MKNIILYNKYTGEILKKITCPDNDIWLQQNKEQEAILEVSNLNFVDSLYKVNIETKQLEKLTQVEENNIKIKNRKFTYPPLSKFKDGSIDKKIILTEIKDYFIEITPEEWCIQNYKFLRKYYYPPIEDFIDGYVKSKDSDESIKIEGENQLNKYIQDCNNIKKLFPKGE